MSRRTDAAAPADTRTRILDTVWKLVSRRGRADLVAIGREMLFNPNWPLHAAVELGVDPEYAMWPQQFGSWLRRRVLLDVSERT